MSSGLQSSGLISLANVNVEILSPSPDTTIEMNGLNPRILAGKLSGEISMDMFYGKRWVIPSSTTYNTPGTYTFVVPRYNRLTVILSAGGGGGAGGYANDGFAYGYNGHNGGNGTDTSFGPSVKAYGGKGAYYATGSGGTNGVSTVGADGGNNLNSSKGGGGSGGAGGAGTGGPAGVAGGSGGSITKSWAFNEAGAPAYDSNVQVVVGSGGEGGRGQNDTGHQAGAGVKGGNGSCVISWT